VVPSLPVAATWVFGLLGLPANPSLFNAALLLVLAGALARRKRAGLVAAILLVEGPAVLYEAGVVVGQATGADVRRLAPLATSADVAPSTSIAIHAASAAGSLAVIVVLVAARRTFPARLPPRALALALTVAGVAVAVATAVGYALVGLAGAPPPGAPAAVPPAGAPRVWWALNVALGQAPSEVVTGHPVAYVPAHPIAQVVSAISALGVVAAFIVFTRSTAATVHPATSSQELAVRRLLLDSTDSLSYFATRRDKSIVLAPDARAAIAFRPVGGVLLASGDPVGDQGSWGDAIGGFLALARRAGWTAAAVGTSPAGASAYGRFGLKSLEMGDEAVLVTADFSLARPGAAPLRAIVRRIRRVGYTVTVRRAGAVSPAEWREIASLAARWRRTGPERGFSMALGRLGDPADARMVVVQAHDDAGRPRGLLTLVPWGRAGLSLDTMRRDDEAHAGVTELMVTELAVAAREMGIAEISLNFAVLRRVLDHSDEVGAFPWRRWSGWVVHMASRWWQMEGLYRANAKYLPQWRPRLVTYDRGAALAQVVVAVGQAEGFVPGMPLQGRLADRRCRPAVPPGERDQFVDRVHDDEARLATPPRPPRWRGLDNGAREGDLVALRAAGLDPYPSGVPRTTAIRDLVSAFATGPFPPAASEAPVAIAGRVGAVRCHGGVLFADLWEDGATVQVMLERAVVDGVARAASSGATYDLFRRHVRPGDIVAVQGTPVATRSGGHAVAAASWRPAAKALCPMSARAAPSSLPRDAARRPASSPAACGGQVRRRETASSMVKVRAAVLAAIRATVAAEGFIEVETPILQRIHGGAAARPFRTRAEASDADVYLRIAPELFLKRLVAAGHERIVEIGRSFRNEGADAIHNPEFTSLEAYAAYWDYTAMRHLARRIIMACAVAVHGRGVAMGQDRRTMDISGPWPVVPVHDAVSRATGRTLTPASDLAAVRDAASAAGVRWGELDGAGVIVARLHDKLVEPSTGYPTFYADFPLDDCPLTRPHRRDPRLAERWDLVGCGMEIGTASTELTDPIDQRERLTAQSLKAAGGDLEAMAVDEEFLGAVAHAMAPMGGLGLGVDRIIMFLTGADIRDTVAFARSRRSAGAGAPQSGSKHRSL
jgi:lysyl-tRNA synthetase class 2